VAYVPAARARHHQQASSRLDYARWIENYTRATILYYQRYGSEHERRRVSELITFGSRLRQVLWGLLSVARPSKRVEAKMRIEGYARAIALAQRSTQKTIDLG